MDSFQFLSAYDKRTSVGTVAASDVHKMVRESKKKLGIAVSNPRAPKARSIDEILDRALAMKVTVEMSSKELTFYPPKFDADGNHIGCNYGQYWITTKAKAWMALDEISVEIVKAKSDRDIALESAKALELIF